MAADSHQPILVVDDEPLIASTLIELLSVHGYRAHGVGSGEEALRVLDEGRHDLVILDINLPGMSGFEACRAIRRKFGAALPIIMLTALGDATALREGYESGTDDFLTKPVDTPLLILKVRAYLRFKAMHDETVRHRIAAQDRARDLAALHGIGRDWSLVAEAEDFHRMVTGRLAALLGAPIVAVVHYDPVEQTMRPALPVHGLDDQRVRNLTFRLPPGHRGLAFLATGRSFFTNATRTEGPLFRDLVGELDLDSILLAPLVSGGQVIGLVVAANKPGGFDDDDARLFSIFAGPAATFLRSREIYKRQERYASRLARLSEISGALGATTGRQPLLELLVSRVQRDLGYARVAFHGSAEGRLHREASAGEEPESSSTDELLWALRALSPLRLEGSNGIAGLAIPVTGVRPPGVIHVVRAEPGPFEDEEVSLLSTLAGQLSVALQKAQSMEETEGLARRMATLYDLGLETAAVRDLRNLLLKATEEAGRLIGADHTSVLRWDDGEKVLRLFAPWGRDAVHERAQSPVFQLGEGIAGVVARDWVPIIANEAAAAPEFVVREAPVARLVCVPLTRYDPERQSMTLFGVLNASRLPGAPPFEKGDVEYLTHFASQISIAVANSLAFASEKDRSDQLALVNSLLGEIAGSLSREDILKTACNRIREAFSYPAVMIFWVDHSSQTCRVAAMAAVDAGRISDRRAVYALSSGAVAGAAAASRTTRVDNVADDPAERPLFDFTRSQLAVPIRSGGEVVAVVSVESDKVGGFDRAHVLTLETLADGIGISLRNADLYEDLQQTNVKLLEADRLKTEVVSLVAHDFRSPLAGILGFAELLEERPDAPAGEHVENARAIIDGVTYLSGLVDKTLKSTRLDSGQFPFHFDIVDLGAVLRSVLARWPTDPSRALEVEVPDDPVPVWGDRERLTEVFENLLSNAFKYTAPGGNISVVAQVWGENIRVQVKDTGVGLAQGDLERVFRPFTRIRNRKIAHVKGAGLGLHICQKIVRAHGGVLTVRSEEGVGSEFAFAIPLYGAEAQARGPLILLATADAAMRRVVRQAAASHPYEVRDLADGVDVVETARRLSPAAILIDRMMPPLGAEDVAERLQLSASTATIPIVVLLGDQDVLPRPELFRAVLRRPVDAAHVAEVLPARADVTRDPLLPTVK